MSNPSIDDPILAGVFADLGTRFPGSVLGASNERGELRVVVRAGDIVSILRHLKSAHGFTALVDIVALDRKGSTEEGAGRFRLIYQVCRFPEHNRFHLAVDLGETEAAPSAVGVYLAADWAEREIYDMFGIRFEGHPDLRRIYLPDDFDGYPLRKDFPLGGRGSGGV